MNLSTACQLAIVFLVARTAGADGDSSRTQLETRTPRAIPNFLTAFGQQQKNTGNWARPKLSVAGGEGRSVIAGKVGPPLTAVVEDEGGRPVSNARVTFTFQNVQPDSRGGFFLVDGLKFGSQAVFTDSNGRAIVWFTASENLVDYEIMVTAEVEGRSADPYLLSRSNILPTPVHPIMKGKKHFPWKIVLGIAAGATAGVVIGRQVSRGNSGNSGPPQVLILNPGSSAVGAP